MLLVTEHPDLWPHAVQAWLGDIADWPAPLCRGLNAEPLVVAVHVLRGQ